MRKYLFLTIAATALLAGCNKQKPEFSIFPEDFGDSDKVRISFNTNTVETKAMKTGTDWGDGSEIILIGTAKYSENEKYDVGNVVFPEGGMPTVSPYGITGKTLKIGSKTGILISETYYYIDKVSYDFYGYHLGETGAKASAKSWSDGKLTISLPDKADADIMVAKADPAVDVLGAEGDEDFDKMNTPPYYNILYSSRSARRSVVPRLTFKHALTAITIKAIKGLDVDETIVMQNLTVNAKKEGTLTVIAENMDEQIALATSTETSPFTITTGTGSGLTLPDHPGEGYESQLQTNSEELGTFLLFPGEEEYKLNLAFSQKSPDATTATDVTADIVIDAPAAGFQAGTHYQITLLVYNNHEITFTTDIIDWKEEEPIIVDPDDF